jgi:hypothetical protein
LGRLVLRQVVFANQGAHDPRLFAKVDAMTSPV